MKKTILILLTTLLLLTIFLFSHQNGAQSISVSDRFAASIIDTYSKITKKEFTETRRKELIKKSRFIVRKSAHYTLYFTLGILIYLILISYKLKKSFIISLIICLVFSSLDELHQLFTTGRTARIYDIYVDTLGSLSGIIITMIIIKLIMIYKNNKEKPNKQA